MSILSVRSAVMGSVDRIARWRIAAKDVHSVGGGTLWTRVDSANDADYENTVKGTDVAAVDSRMAAVDTGAAIRGFFDRHTDYFSAQGIGNFDNYLAQQRFRIHEEGALLWYSAYGQRLTNLNVMPTASRVVGHYSKGAADAWTPGGGIASPTVGPAIIEAVVEVLASPGAVLSIALACQAGSPVKVLGLTLTSGAAGSKFAVGGQVLVSITAPGDTTIGLAATGQFNVGDVIMLTQSGMTERAMVSSISANAYLKVNSGLVNSFTTAALAYPLFYVINSAAGASGTNSGDIVRFQPKEERVPAW